MRSAAVHEERPNVCNCAVAVELHRALGSQCVPQSAICTKKTRQGEPFSEKFVESRGQTPVS